MPAMYLTNNIGKNIAELYFGHGIGDVAKPLVKIKVHTVFWREPIKTGVRFFEHAPEHAIILL
jgi:hypothetical protein